MKVDYEFQSLQRVSQLTEVFSVESKTCFHYKGTYFKVSLFLQQWLDPQDFLLHLSITYRLLNSKLNRQMRFSLPSIKCSAAPSSF